MDGSQAEFVRCEKRLDGMIFVQNIDRSRFGSSIICSK